MRIRRICVIVNDNCSRLLPVLTRIPAQASPTGPRLHRAGLPSLHQAADVLGPAQRRVVVACIVGLHLLAIWGLWQVRAVREAATQVAPILVSLLAAPVPPAPPQPAPQPVPKPQPRAKPQPAPQPPVLATTASPTPESITVPPPLEAPAPLPAPAQPTAAVATPTAAAPAAPPPAPKQLPDDAVQYLVAPQLVYPPLSVRRHETGLVVVRAYIGTEGGAPRTVQVERGSGHARLDQAALSAVQHARFRPYAEKGQPVEGWALIPIRFELEK